MKKLLPLSAMMFASAALAQPVISAQSIIVNPTPSEVNVRVWVDKDPSGQRVPDYRIGESIRISTTVNQDAYVYLFNIAADGKINQILPNRFPGGENFLRAGETRSFPAANASFRFDIGGPVGLNKVLAVASRTELNTTQIAQFERDQELATARIEGQDRLAQALSIIVNPVPQNTWRTAIAYFNVAPAQAARTGSLFVGTNVSGANVFLNERNLGRANVTYSDIAPGSYRLRISAPGYQDFTTSVTIRANTTLNVNAQLTQAAPARSTLVLRSNVEGALVFIDGRQQGVIRGGQVSLTLERGSYQVTLIAPGHTTYVGNINIVGNATATANLTRLR